MASLRDADCLCGSCVRFLYGDLHSKVGSESVTRLPDFDAAIMLTPARRVPPTWSQLVRCRRSCSASAEEWQCHVLDLSTDSTKFPVMPTSRVYGSQASPWFQSGKSGKTARRRVEEDV